MSFAMNILFVAKPLSPKGNGVVSALKTEVLYLQKIANVALYNIGVPLESDIADTMFTPADYPTISSLPEPFCKPDIVVFEEVYKLDYFKLYNECLKNRIPYVIIPHGCLVAVEQNKKKLKHVAANMLIFNRFIRKAEAVQYLNEQERDASAFKCRRRIIIPNSVEYRERKYDIDRDTFRFIYVGRYDITVKGLDLMVDTFIDLKDWCRENGVVLELYGPIDENPDLELLSGKIATAECDDIIKIGGAIYGDDKDKALQSASVFIQTSRNEGQPMGIIEALSFAMPCVVTYATSFGEYCERNNCGIGVNFSKEELAAAIKRIFTDKEYFELCRKNAVENMKKDFDTKAVAENTLRIYKDLLSE